MAGQGFVRPETLQGGYQNGNYTDESFDLFTNVQNHDLNWDLNTISNDTLAQSAASHLNWQQPTAVTPGLDAYGRPFSKSPSNIEPSTNYGYGDLRQFSQTAYDPSLVPPSPMADPSSTYVGHSPYSQHGTIAPQALQHGQPQFSQSIGTLDGQGHNRNPGLINTDLVRSTPPAPIVNQATLCAAIPSGDTSGIFSIINFEKLASATNTKRANVFVNVGQQDFEYPVNKTTVSTPARRKSRAELRLLAKNDPKLLAKLGKKHHKKAHSTPSISRPQKPVFPSKQWQPTPGIKYEGDSSSSEYSSSEESDDDYSDDEVAEPSPLPPKRPDTPLEAAKYDSVKATWRSKRFQIDGADIRTALKDFWEVVRTIRDRWKTDTAAVTEAEEKKKHGEIPLLKSRVKNSRDMLEAALSAAIQHGHKDILELFGENKSFLYLLYQFLVDRFKEDDFDSSLTRSILQTLATCTTLSEENLEATRLGKVYPRFAKKGSPETQALVKRIDANVAEYKKKKAAEASTSANDVVDAKAVDPKAPKSPPSTRPTPEPVAGVKRAAPSGATSGQPTKRVASGPASPASVTSSTTSKAAPAVKRTVPNSAVGKPSTNSMLAATRPKAPVTKSIGGALTASSGIKKPINTKAGASSVVANAIKSIEKKAIAPASSTGPAKPAFSFAETMANLTKPKEKEPSPSKEEDKRPPETAEQKSKRIRKEQRRKLRVTFKPDNQLVEVRLFHHDAEEEFGHEASMIRDVSDVGGEGRMFKQHKDMVEAEDDEEPGQEDIRSYNAPTLTDFSVVDEDERKRNYAPYGGGELQAESPERIVREQYEANTLMAYDSPPCPREPADPYNGEPMVTKNFGAPDPQSTVATRVARLAYQPTVHQPQVPTTSGPDISAILAMIKPQQHQPSSTAPPMTAQVPDQMSGILGILATLPQPSVQQQQQQQQQMTTQPPMSAVTPDIASILANLQPQGNGASVTTPIPQQQHASAVPMPGMAPPSNLAAILGQLNQGQGKTAGVPSVGNFGQFGFPAPSFDMQKFGQTQQQTSTFENEDRRRWREGGEEDVGAQGRKWAGKKGMNKRYTLPCKYYKQGKCQKGDNCTYLHD